MRALNDGVKEKFVGRLGVECLDVLYEFLDIVVVFMSENTPSLSGFLRWFHSFEHEIKRESFSNADSVRLMTAHSSKGLQSPFVILADSHFSKPPKKDILKSEDGILIWSFSSEMRPKIVGDLFEKYKNFNDEESKRLLYVALTRAEDFLYVFGEQPSQKIPENCWYNFIKRNMNVNKFEKLQKDGHTLLKYGKYGHSDSESPKNEENISEKNHFEIPNWFFEKLNPPLVNDDEVLPKTEQMIYGECVHLLLSEMPKYMQCFDLCADNFLSGFDVSDDIKNASNQRHTRF